MSAIDVESPTSTASSPLRALVLETSSMVEQCKRRMWTARDRCADLQRQLSIATAARDNAEREHDAVLELLTEQWNLLRKEFEA